MFPQQPPTPPQPWRPSSIPSPSANTLLKLPEWVPTPFNLRATRARERLDRIIFEIIAERRASGSSQHRTDLLSMLLNAQDEDDGGQMTDRQLRDEAMTLFMAGHETTANTLAWVWYLLSLNPEVETKLHEEVDRVLGGRCPYIRRSTEAHLRRKCYH